MFDNYDIYKKDHESPYKLPSQNFTLFLVRVGEVPSSAPLQHMQFITDGGEVDVGLHHHNPKREDGKDDAAQHKAYRRL